MIYMFFGDSHSRQFVGTSWGIFCHYVFSGATIKGLSNNSSKTGHSRIIKSAVGVDAPKVLFFMFGSVDLDFTYVKSCCLGEFSSPKFVDERIDIYCNFLSEIRLNDSNIKNILVMAPQLSPLIGENFFAQTKNHIEIDEAIIRRAATHLPLSDAERCEFVINFNDRLEASLRERLGIELLRIDRLMLGPDGVIDPAFVPTDPSEHHARIDQTQNLWRPIINEFITDRVIVG